MKTKINKKIINYLDNSETMFFGVNGKDNSGRSGINEIH